MRYLTLEIRETSLVEYAGPDSNDAVNVIWRNQIRAVSLQNGSYAERPLLQITIAALLLLFGLVSIIVGPALALHSEKLVKLIVLPLIPLALGGWALRDSLRRGAYLHVETAGQGTRKLRLPKSVDEA